jgi:branched-chain amino acid transport system permease protein
MIAYGIAGLVFGGVYALSATGIVMTFRSAGVLNFAYGALAYFVARFFYYLNTQQHWPTWAAAVTAILLAGPALGIALWAVLFRALRLATELVKVVATIGLAVAIPPVTVMLLGNIQIQAAPGLAPQPVRVFHVFGAALTMDQIISYICIIVVLLVSASVLQFTSIGLKVRAMVDSEAMTSLSGTNAAVVSAGVWAASILMAGLAGVLIAPVIGLDSNNFTLLMAAAFASVIAARMRSLLVATLVGLVMGVGGSIIQGSLPASSAFAAAVQPSIPFVVIVICLIFYTIRDPGLGRSRQASGALDASIRINRQPASSYGQRSRVSSSVSGPGWTRRLRDHPVTRSRNSGALALIVIVALAPLVLSSFWGGLIGEAAAFGVAFVAYTLITGEGGMIWLCQVTLAGVGAVATAELGGSMGWPIIPAILAGGLVAGILGTIIGLLTMRFGNLYVALTTLTFGLLMDQLVFQQGVFYQYGAGVSVGRPSFAASNSGFDYLAIVAFCIVAVFAYNLRNSTTGLAIGAARSGETAARAMGINVTYVKVLVSGLGALIAGIGGGLLAVYAGAAVTSSFSTLVGITWLAVVVTIGIRSTSSALAAGIAYTFFPALVLAYLPLGWAQVPVALFGLGAVLVTRNPDGTVEMVAAKAESLARAVLGGRGGAKTAPHGGSA